MLRHKSSGVGKVPVADNLSGRSGPSGRFTAGSEPSAKTTKTIHPLPQMQKPKSAREAYNEISVAELRSFLNEKKQNDKSRRASDPNIHFHRHTIGKRSSLSSSVNPITSDKYSDSKSMEAWASKSLPDLFGLEEIVSKEENVGQVNLYSEKPLSWKTTFDIDAPRRPISTTSRSQSRRQASSVSPNLAEHISGEQALWAGIDNVLADIRSVDESVAYSTSDILPRATVSAMRRKGNRPHNSSTAEKETYKKLLNPTIAKPRSKAFNKPPVIRGSRRAKSLDSTLFDMFKWSEKTNIDEQQESKRKLNQRPTSLATLLSASDSRLPPGSDHTSLPSLAAITAMSRQTNDSTTIDYTTESSVDAVEEYDSSLVATEENETISHRSIKTEDEDIDSKSSSTDEMEKLIIDKDMEEYIRRIEIKLPTITEDLVSSFIQLKLAEESRNGSDSSGLDMLPYLSPKSQVSSSNIDSLSTLSTTNVTEQKEPKPSLSNQVINKIKKIRSKAAIMKVHEEGDERFYFPKDEYDQQFMDQEYLLNGAA